MIGTTIMHKYDESSPKITLELHEDATTNELLDMVVTFMRAVGYTDGAIYGSMAGIASELAVEGVE